jgi:hypothetical protein
MNRVTIIEEENQQIEREIAEILNETKLEEVKSIKVLVDSVDTSPQPQTGYRRVPGYIQLLYHSVIDRFLFIGLTFAEETNLKSLEEYYDFLRLKHSRLEETASTKYTIREKRVELQTLFEQKLADLDNEREQRLTLRNRLRLYHLVWRTIKKYVEDEKNLSNTRTDSVLLEDMIMKAIYESTNLFPKSIIFFLL